MKLFKITYQDGEYRTSWLAHDITRSTEGNLKFIDASTDRWVALIIASGLVIIEEQ